MKYMFIPTGIKRELVRFGVDLTGTGQLSVLLEEERWPSI
jgi:hypothetical protein